MKIGLIADIHGDLENLTTALKLLAAQNVDEILCAGDLVDRGKHGDAVTKTITRRKIPTVRGNHDETPFEPEWLTLPVLNILRQLPTLIRFQWDGLTVCLAHGTPKDPWRYVYADSSPQLYEDVLYQARANIVILGHTHQPMVARIDNGAAWVFNPGTISRDCSRVPSCAVLTLPVYNEANFDFQLFALESGQRIKPRVVEIQTTNPQQEIV